jgi:hypothetical protein
VRGEERGGKGAGFDGITAAGRVMDANGKVETGHGEIIAESRAMI